MPFSATIDPSRSACARSAIADRQLRSAARARVRLGVEASIGRGVVFRAARLAHLEAAHRRRRAIVGKRLADGEARPARRAIRERIRVAPIGRIQHLLEAVAAGGQIVQHAGRVERAGVAAGNHEPGGAHGRHPAQLLRRHAGRRRPLARQAGGEVAEAIGGALHLDHDAVARVLHVARELEAAREPVDERPQANPLNGSAKDDAISMRFHRTAASAGPDHTPGPADPRNYLAPRHRAVRSIRISLRTANLERVAAQNK